MNGERLPTEADIQDSLFKFLAKKKINFIVPNVNLYYSYESDLVSVSGAKFVSEYEIKISVSDFRAEFKNKRHKHTNLSDQKITSVIPNYFFFVFPVGLWLEKEQYLKIPEYAGLITVGEEVRVIKKAPRLHSEKANSDKLAYLGRGLMYRFWDKRLGR